MKTFVEEYGCLYEQAQASIEAIAAIGPRSDVAARCVGAQEEDGGLVSVGYDTDDSDGFWSGKLRSVRGEGSGWQRSEPIGRLVRKGVERHEYRNPHIRTFAYWRVACQRAGSRHESGRVLEEADGSGSGSGSEAVDSVVCRKRKREREDGLFVHWLTTLGHTSEVAKSQPVANKVART